jgi:hypothetical protein
MYWGGPAVYQGKIDQLFDYLVWRHTDALLVTFSRRRSITEVLDKAVKSTEGHESFRHILQPLVGSRFATVHAHPQDPNRQVTIHDLVFDLHADSDAAGEEDSEVSCA